MATESKTATEEVKIDLFEDDDEFEEFEINEGSVYDLSTFFLNSFKFFTTGSTLPAYIIFHTWFPDVQLIMVWV